MMTEDPEELGPILDDAAHDFAGNAPDVDEWDAWLEYLLEGLELQAASLDREHPFSYESMLKRLQAKIENRLKEGVWK
ncbi:MAG: hypothetical protein P8X95_04600 [Anaerolineales bacterium]|jgi:hypothetical protein